MNVWLAIHNLIALSMRTICRLHDEFICLSTAGFCEKYRPYIDSIMEEYGVDERYALRIIGDYADLWYLKLEHYRGQIKVYGDPDYIYRRGMYICLDEGWSSVRIDAVMG